MDQRRWEDLNIDCLVNIFGRGGMESLLLDVSFVCNCGIEQASILHAGNASFFQTFQPAILRKCGDPKVLALPGDLVYLRSSVIPKLTGEWKHLEEILSRSSFDKDEAIAVVNFRPKIKKLILVGMIL
ncbi:PREDICTED: F-box/LRR-repeat [Prunus dulcis]|uniref:PREDICTED: F-box/LRR-repeat n=1 Tax=Prunus dulcis TaxID=3755 RepID=A0A5E4FC00_PRUDU|nr:hypothetical protein L3X38_002693 [Prunus dulcis]VVA25475.1 PREDICTED: F-box/LRR-repeat [Prunus dulcis]